MLPQKFSAATTSITRDCPGVAVSLAALQAVASMVSATGPAAAASHRDAWPRRVLGQWDVVRPPWQRRHGRPAVTRDRPAGSHGRPAVPSRIVVYRRPLMARAEDDNELSDLVFDVVVEEFAQILGLDPEVIDPGYRGGFD